MQNVWQEFWIRSFASRVGYKVWSKDWTIVRVNWMENNVWCLIDCFFFCSYFINHYTKTTSWEDPRVRYQQIGKATSKENKKEGDSSTSSNVAPPGHSDDQPPSSSGAPLKVAQLDFFLFCYKWKSIKEGDTLFIYFLVLSHWDHSPCEFWRSPTPYFTRCAKHNKEKYWQP